MMNFAQLSKKQHSYPLFWAENRNKATFEEVIN